MPQQCTCAHCGASFFRPRGSKGLYCSYEHYWASMRERDIAARFWSKVDQTDLHGCWPWRRGGSSDGYGRFWQNGQSRPAHVVAYELTYLVCVLDGYVGRHKCDNPPCCRPDHIVVCTHADNVADKVAKGRQARGDRHGSRTHGERLRRGEAHPHAKLTREKADAVRLRHADGVTLAQLAAEHGVAVDTIWSVVHNKTWR